MGSRIIRSTTYVTVSVLLLVAGTLLLANLNVQPVHAGGGGDPQPLHVLFSAKSAANATFTIQTTQKNFLVHSLPTDKDYNLAELGTDYICIHKAGTDVERILCIPYSAILRIDF